jgi:hypothetical protein
MSGSGSLNVSFLVLWLTISDFSSSSDWNPWSPPVKAFFPDAPDCAGIFFASSDGGALPCCPDGASPPLR